MTNRHTLALALMLACSSLALAQDPNQPTNSAQQRGFAMPSQSLNQPTLSNPAQSGALKATIKPAKKTYVVGEPVTFTARANRDFYLYIFNLASDGTTIPLYPNEREPNNRLRGGVSHSVPSQYDIVVDDPGREKILVVSTLSLLDADGARGIVVPGADTGGGQRQTAEFNIDIVPLATYAFTVNTKPENARVKVLNIGPKYQAGMKLPAGDYKLEVTAEGFQTADITVKHAEKQQNHEVILAEVILAMVDDGTPQIILTSEQHVFKAGEEVVVQYGASRAGWVHLYTWIGGDLVNVAARQVEGGNFYTLKATATEPHGEQILVALWQGGEGVDKNMLSNLRQALADKPKDTKPVAGEQRALVIQVEEPVHFKTLPLMINP